MSETNVIEKIEENIQVQEPKKYQVILFNDDRTTFEFVIGILVGIFHKTFEEAYEITVNIHNAGQGIAGGPYTKEIADEKVSETINYSRSNGFPLTAIAEEI
jgi:ATP-dependent Clp protease adaptor protein ClpS